MRTATKSHSILPSALDSHDHGQGVRARVDARQRELERELTEGDLVPALRADIEAALGALDSLLTGDLDQISPVVAAQLSHWLEGNKYLALKASSRGQAPSHSASR